MATTARPPAFSPPRTTHAVANQAVPLEGVDLFSTNVPLVEALEREGGGHGRARCEEVGRAWGGEPLEWGFQANEHPPRLRTHDRFGNRIDEVEFHPAWHRLMDLAARHELHVARDHVVRAAAYLTATQAEAGFACPTTMTAAAQPVLERWAPGSPWLERLRAPVYEPALAAGKVSARCGMAMTEKQGGSDVRANTTTATPDEDAPGWSRLHGHKWFCSAPMSDLFLVLAQAGEGVSCFLVPRVLPDGTRNAFRLQRLKDKLGNRSNASSEVEFDGTYGELIGEPGRGVPTIIEMVGHTRLDCVIGSAALMRWAVANATWHTAHRSAFGRRLADQPLMGNVLADLCVESEAATALALRLARAYEEDDVLLKRLGTAIGKYWVCKRAPGLSFEALECLGGNGYVEESGMPRLYREAPLNSVWEGSGNVNALDLLRALVKTPPALDAYRAEVEAARGADERLDRALDAIPGLFADAATLEVRARAVVERLAVTWQAALLARFAPAPVADAFCATRLTDGGHGHYGTLPASIDHAAIVARHAPALA